MTVNLTRRERHDRARDALLDAAAEVASHFGDVSGSGLSFTADEQRVLVALYRTNDEWQAAQSALYGQPDPEDLPSPGRSIKGFIEAWNNPAEPRVVKHEGATPGPHQTPPPPSRRRRVKKPRSRGRR